MKVLLLNGSAKPNGNTAQALEAAAAAVWIHGKAGDLMAEQYGRRGMTASNVMLEGIPAVLKELE